VATAYDAAGKPMRRTRKIIGVADVGRSFERPGPQAGPVHHPAGRSSDSATSSLGLERQAPQ
jgi:hypothetical protein